MYKEKRKSKMHKFETLARVHTHTHTHTSRILKEEKRVVFNYSKNNENRSLLNKQEKQFI